MEKSEFKILVAEDDEITRDMLVTLLEAEGYPVASAVDGMDAIRLLRLDDIRMVITDYKMPSADGIEVLRHALRANPDVAVVLLTAYGGLDTILETISEGAYDFITKPFNNRQIAFVVDKAYQRALLIEENRALSRQLKDTYRDFGLLRSFASSRNPEVTVSVLERLEKLRRTGVLTDAEADTVKGLLLEGDGGETLRQGEGEAL